MKRSLALALAAFLGLGLLSTSFAGFAQDAYWRRRQLARHLRHDRRLPGVYPLAQRRRSYARPRLD